MKRKHFLQSFIPAALGSVLFKQAFALPDPVTDLPMKMPAYLKPGDTIGITCPAGPMMADELKLCRKALDSWGFNIKFGDTINKKWQRFGGTDEERAADLQALLDDENINAILFGRGGYGVIRMMDKINWAGFAQKPKWLVGYSDITAFHCHVHSMYSIPTIHADMGNGFNSIEDDASLSLKNMLMGNKQEYRAPGHQMNRAGTVSGKVVGGNLSLLVAMQGSKSALNTAGKILFIEDVSEYKYTIDRMMMNLKRSGMLDNPAAVVFGGFTATKADSEEEFPMAVEDILYEKVKEYDYPVCFHFPAGHQRLNLALKLGCNYTLDVSKTNILLKEAHATSTIIELPNISDSTFSPTLDSTKILTDSLKLMK